jgi:hypothetical protein
LVCSRHSHEVILARAAERLMHAYPALWPGCPACQAPEQERTEATESCILCCLLFVENVPKPKVYQVTLALETACRTFRVFAFRRFVVKEGQR